MSTPLRIGVFVAMFPQLSETFIVTKVLKLLDAGIDVQIFALAESPHWDHFQILAGRDDVRARCHVVPPLDRSPRALTRGVGMLARAAATSPRSFARYLRHNWDVRHETSHGFWKAAYLRTPFIGQAIDILHIEFDAQGVGIADLKRLLGCRVLCSARGTFQQLSVLDANPKACDYLFRYVDGYHVISRFLETNTRGLGLPDDVPVWLIEPAIDVQLFTPVRRATRPTAEPIRILSVGRLSWEKGYEMALDAIAKLRARGVALHYTICGSGPYEEPIRFAIQQLQLGDCVTMLGAVKRETMPEVYANADILLHSALAEGFCNAVIEAQSMGLAVVTTDAGGLPENVAHGVTGYVVPRRDASALTDKLELLARSEELRKKLGEAGRRRVLERFDLDRQAEAFLALYRELAARPVRPISS